jgi:integrase
MISKPETATLRLSAWVDRFVESKGLSERAARPFLGSVCRLEQFAGRELVPDDVDDALLDAWCAALVADGSHANTARRQRNQVRKVLAFAHGTDFDGSFELAATDPAAPLTMQTWISRYSIEKQVAKGTSLQLRYSVNSLERFVGRPVLVAELCDQLLNDWLANRHAGNGGRVSAGTISRDRRNVLSLWNHACKMGHNENRRRYVLQGKCPKRPPVAWSIEEVRHLLTVVQALPGRFPCGAKRSDFWAALVRTAWDTALRRGDLLALTTSNYSEGRIVVLQGKTGWPKISALQPETIEAIRRAGCFERELWFPWPFSREWFTDYFAKVVKSSGIRRGTFKWLRRASATAAEIASPGSATALLGHRTANMARDHYIDPLQVQHAKPPAPALGPCSVPLRAIKHQAEPMAVLLLDELPGDVVLCQRAGGEV